MKIREQEKVSVKKKISLILSELLLQGQGRAFSESDDGKSGITSDIDRDFFHGHGIVAISSSLSVATKKNFRSIEKDSRQKFSSILQKFLLVLKAESKLAQHAA